MQYVLVDITYIFSRVSQKVHLQQLTEKLFGQPSIQRIFEISTMPSVILTYGNQESGAALLQDEMRMAT